MYGLNTRVGPVVGRSAYSTLSEGIMIERMGKDRSIEED